MTYTFDGRLTAYFPSQVLVDVTEVCNLACGHCAHDEFSRSGRYEARMLDVALNDKLVTEVAASSVRPQFIRYTGSGETTLHPSIYEMVQRAVRHSGVPVTLTTNGVKLDVARLLDTGLHAVDVSIDALYPETYQRVRGRDRLGAVRKNVLALLQQKRARVFVSFIEQDGNREETEDFRAYWTEQGAGVLIRPLHSCAGEMPVQLGSGARRPCVYPWERIVLTADGHLSFCPASWSHRSHLADYREVTIAQTWTSPAYEALRNAHLTNDFAQHSFCGACPDWAVTSWPGGEVKGYAERVP